MAGPVDESESDDGAMYRFWDYLALRRRLRKPDFDLEDLFQLLQAVNDFNDQVDT
jgi:hypothetical protein